MVHVTLPPAPEEPAAWRAAARRLLGRLRPGRGPGIGATEAAEFDAAARQAYQAALKLDRGMPLAPAQPEARSAEAPRPVPDSAIAAGESAWATQPGPPNSLSERLAVAGGESPEQVSAAPQQRQPGETAPGSLLRTPSNVTLVADEFFDSLIRRVESDR